ncbi:MAG: hypothetical protein IEMM0002_1570 [bacterium]|nr:MAG: hypothetical protein IEMM0002_1570 [bacterium]
MKINFDSVWGQSSACSVLSGNIRRNRVAGAYLFSGPSGTGKTLTAGIFAGSLLCESRLEQLPCGKCRSCRMFGAGSHPDFTRVAPDGTMIKIEQVRALISSLSMKSYGGGRKLCVMEEADKMNPPAANAFLKTLEEPPPDTVLILVTSSPSALLPTIVSRCRTVRFVPMRPEELGEMLEREKSFSREDAFYTATLAEGCPGRALGGEVDLIKRVDGEAMDLMAAILNMKPDEVIRFAEGWRKRRDDLPVLTDRILEILRFAGRRNFHTSSGTMAAVMKTFTGVPQGWILEGFEEILDLKPDLRFNPNVQIFLESIIFNLQSIFMKGEPVAGRIY